METLDPFLPARATFRSMNGHFHFLRWTSPGFLVILALAACFSDRTSSRDHEGMWESTYRGRGGEANSFVLHGDSLVDRYFMKAFDFRFTTFGDSLRIQPIVPDSFLPAGDTAAPIVVVHYSVKADTLIRTEAHRTEWLVREGPPPGNPYAIIGTWKAVRSTDAFTLEAYHRYRPDSVLEVRLPVSVKHGVYKIRPDSLTFYFSDGDTTPCALTLRGDSLDLTHTFTNGTFTYDYVRINPGPWYRLEEY